MIEHINNWLEAQEKLFANSYDEKLQRYRSKYVFRGLSDSQFSLKTSLMRLGGDYQKLELNILRNFQKYSYKLEFRNYSLLEILIIGQHYGLPTRLLDWTYSPLVALHFATCDLTQNNGAIWAVSFKDVHGKLPDDLRATLKNNKANVFTLELLKECNYDFDKLNKAAKNLGLFIEPPSMDERVVNQFALFSLLSNPDITFDDWAKQNEIEVKKFILTPKAKWEIRDKLDQSNINERILFPGLKGLSVWLKRHYSSKEQ